MGNCHIERWWKKPAFTNQILNIIFDEAHCIQQWGSFHKEYLHVGELRYLIPNHIPFYVASATLPPALLADVIETLHLQPGMTEHITLSNGHPNLCLMVCSLVFPANSHKDLRFLIPDNRCEGDSPLPKFLVFFDNTKEAEATCKWIQRQLPKSEQKKVKYFHSMMMPQYREENFDGL